jgi:activator of HSP90 ATPase
MAFAFKLTATIPATPRQIYDAWLSSRGHSPMTGGKAKTSAKAGGLFTAWDGYISGRNIILEPPRRIVQAWRTTRFGAADLDSQVELLLVPAKGGTRLTLRHSNVPDGHDGYRNGGWQTHYFEPMKKYFAAKRRA